MQATHTRAAALAVCLALGGCTGGGGRRVGLGPQASRGPTSSLTPTTEPVAGGGLPGMPPLLDSHDVYAADECFLTGTAAEVIGVVKCDGRLIGDGRPGPITRQLRERFQQLVRE